MRSLLSVVFGLCLLASACSGDSDVAQPLADVPADVSDTSETTTDGVADATDDVGAGSPGERVRVASVGWNSVGPGDSPDAAMLSFTGGPAGDLDVSPCAGEYEVDIIESGTEVRITMFQLALAGAERTPCILGGVDRDMAVALGVSFGGRTFVDGHDGSTKFQSDPAAPTPTETPVFEVDPSFAWSASESTRDVSNYLEALRQGAYEQAAWPANGNGILFDGQSPDEPGAEFLARICAGGMCNGPYLVRGQQGSVLDDAAQSIASVTVAHVEAGKRNVLTLVTFEGQRILAQLPPLVDSVNEAASLNGSLFGDSAPQHVVVERFDAFEIWDGESTNWVTNWHAATATRIEGDVVRRPAGVFGLSDPQDVIHEECAQLIERNGDVIVVTGCGASPWVLTNTSTGETLDPPLEFEELGDGDSLWFSERGGSVLIGTRDSAGNLRELTTADGLDMLSGDYASQVVLSGDGAHVAYVEHNDARASSNSWSPVVVVRNVASGDEVGRWELNSSVSCLDFAVDWVVACEADDATLQLPNPDQTSLVAINVTSGELNRVATATRVFLPAVPPNPTS